ncbi:SbcC/MukB-like Walker B domain-containing protein [Streptomyces achromogenes]|uniref:SbcC/MukB-like Walker B domain-containing protein n=1 Tax=Streptomyces achromogenes TaxID=67255 RepID=UPI0036F97F3D
MSNATSTAGGRRPSGPPRAGKGHWPRPYPPFAAASSHYASAGGEHAPRLVTLDEAFAGVNDDSRAKRSAQP